MLPASRLPPGFKKLEITAVAAKPPLKVKSMNPLVGGESSELASTVTAYWLAKQGAAARIGRREQSFASVIDPLKN
jgi:hypothetical protein